MNVSRLIAAVVVLFIVVPLDAAQAVYNAGTGHWMTRDPDQYVDGSNLYEYAQSGPLSRIDPFGMSTTPVIPVWQHPACRELCSRPIRDPYGRGVTYPSGISGCDGNGNRISCNCIRYPDHMPIPSARPGKQATFPILPSHLQALSDCVDECEGLHQFNYQCNRIGFDQVICDGNCGRYCSECQAATCADNCMARVNCSSFGAFRDECQSMKQLIRDFRNYMCNACATCTSPPP